jgi:hypothetical protein
MIEEGLILDAKPGRRYRLRRFVGVSVPEAGARERQARQGRQQNATLGTTRSFRHQSPHFTSDPHDFSICAGSCRS